MEEFEMLLRYYGNALLTIEQGETKLLIDPFFSRNPRLYRPTAKDFDGVTAVLITHGHFDHIYDLPKLLERSPGLDIYCTR
ncbi:MAG: MBL fold metallo-hydrolase, partial [Oscillospiraceae bacterium]|nr:MBL fold metallo-hydrolase [Oscillospiraceae bacterium]